MSNISDRAAPVADSEPVSVTEVDIDDLAYRFWSVHPSELDEWVKTAPKMPDGYKGGIRTWFFTCEMRQLAAAPQPNPSARGSFASVLHALLHEGKTIYRESVPRFRYDADGAEIARDGFKIWQFDIEEDEHVTKHYAFTPDDLTAMDWRAK